MRVGYVSANYSLDCRPDRTIKLASISRALEVARSNLLCLKTVLKWNLEHHIMAFRISSNTVPFASHRDFKDDWRDELGDLLGEIGDFARENSIRLSMHPGQYTLLNSRREEVVKDSVEELRYHADLLDLMGVEGYVQVHLGERGKDKEESMGRFVANFRRLPEGVARRLVVENDDRIYTLTDCLRIHGETGTPVVLDNLHHHLNNDGTPFPEALRLARGTWKVEPMLDYSEQEPGGRPGTHAETISKEVFREYAETVREGMVTLEVRDKEKSALKAVEVLKELRLLE